jgi:hypothetical protein
MVKAGKTSTGTSSTQHRLSLFLIALLVIIGGIIAGRQHVYDPTAWRQQPETASGPSVDQGDRPQELAPLSPPESYSPGNLSDKINGKADLYLSAGFKHLETHRWGVVSDQQRWMERYVYHMGGHENAYAVYSLQRRQETRDMDITSHSYISANGLFLVHGPYYLEIVAAEATSEMQSHMKALALAFIASHPAAPESLPVLDLFPSDHRLPHSRKLIADSAFGIQPLVWIYTAAYASGDALATVFISKRRSAGEARSLAGEFMAHWKAYGGQQIQAPEGHPGAQIAFILDNYEIAETQGDYLYGVHETTHLDFGLALVARVRQTIDQGEK